MNKIIHYCWFGGKPLPKLAKKCIKSWRKYLPDFEIKEWNENNFDVNMTKFSKQAYEAKKWAFVSDVARIYALKEYGGIYFDTDMIVSKNIDFLLGDEVFAGWESEYNVAVGVLGVDKKDNELINKIWNFYCENEFSLENVYQLSIPTILTNILKSEYGLVSNHLENQKLIGGIVIYARDYFYPISCDKSPSMFTNRTCMVHYYVGSWLSSGETKRIKFQMVFGKKLGNTILDILVALKHFIKKCGKVILFPYVLYRRKKIKEETYRVSHIEMLEEFSKINNEKYVIFCNKNWLGTSNATKELFDNVVKIEELNDDRMVDDILNIIVEKNIKFVGFSALAVGWDKLIKKIKNYDKDIIIKVIWHGSNAMNVEYYDWMMYEELFRLHDAKLINSIAFVKKSMYEFYKKKGYNVEFLLNTINLNQKQLVNIEPKKPDKYVHIGLYASGDRWVKNFYNQLGAASLFENNKIDCIPITEKTLKLAKIFKTTVTGLSSPIAREKLIERMAKNDINFYVTFSECGPIIPLESLEVGVPCITSHNHHYWDDTPLEKYLYVEENDNMMKIYEKAKYCLDHREEILELYTKWKKDYDKKVKKSIDSFLEKKKNNEKEN